MNYCDRERNRILNELEMVSQSANQTRFLLAKDDLDVDARERAELVLMRQRLEIKMLSNLLSQIDAGVSALAESGGFSESSPALDPIRGGVCVLHCMTRALDWARGRESQTTAREGC